MKRHHDIDLWAFAARELEGAAAEVADAHLSDCAACRAELAGVLRARDVLRTAVRAAPRLGLERTDRAISDLVSRQLEKRARPVRWGLWAAPIGAAAVAALVFLVLPWLGSLQARPVVAPTAAAAVDVTGAKVERAQSASVDGSASVLEAGDALAQGRSLRTRARGEALLRLPDGSRVRLAGGTGLALARAATREVDLGLESGRVAVHAAHVPREAFTVRAGDVTVHVLGTTFAVTRAADFVEVSVLEGRVGVESPRGLPFFVSAGQRVRVGAKGWRPVAVALAGPLKDELVAVAPAQAARAAPGGPAVVPAPRQAKAPAPPATVLVPLVVTPLDPAPPVDVAGQGVAEDPAAQWATPSEFPVAPAPGPGEVARGGAAPDGAARAPAAPRTPSPTQQAQVPAALPAQATQPALLPASPPEATVPPAPAVNDVPDSASPGGGASLGPLPEDIEELFLMRAERSLRGGDCARYQLGLAEIAEDPAKTFRQERARIARARCYEALQQLEFAAMEYVRYRRDFPVGLFIREAQRPVRAVQAPAPAPAAPPGK